MRWPVTMKARTFTRRLGIFLAAASLGLISCGGQEESSCDGDSSGDSDLPTDGFISSSPATTFVPPRSEGGLPSDLSPDQGVGDPERDVAEAEILQVKDDKLYALSQYGGLSVIDISVKDQIKVLGRYRLRGIPFEMHLRDGILYTIFSSLQEWQINDEPGTGYHSVGTSRVEALDVTQPASIHSIGSFELPGKVYDGRVIGDVLYTASFEGGSCLSCNSLARTMITSISVADPAKIGIVSQLSVSEGEPGRGNARHSVSVAPQRMYVAGGEGASTSEPHSTIQVVDISDPTGALVLGATVEVAGEITRRSQMDEYNGVLRVVSQRGAYRSEGPLTVQTFSVLSAKDVQPLGSTELDVPTAEELLASVRFDGPRAYATTRIENHKDWLFTIDLSDPATPRQAGALEMYGRIFHIEPRGDRLLTLGHDSIPDDDQSPAGKIDVSLLDVSSMAAPALIQSVGFGGSWSDVSLDQDRIQRTFTISDDGGSLMIPYRDDHYDERGCETWAGGVQLIDFTASSLVKRGVVPSRGKSQRTLVQDGRLFAVSAAEVQTFNIDDPSAPAAVADLALTTNAIRSVAVGDHVVRLREEPWKRLSHLDVVPAEDPGTAEPLGTLDLTPFRSKSAGSCNARDFSSARLLSNGQHVYLIWPSGDPGKARVAVIDIADVTQPKITGQIELDADLDGLEQFISVAPVASLVVTGKPVVQTGTTLVFRRLDYSPSSGPSDEPELRKAFLEVVDLSDPAKPAHAATVELPAAAGHMHLNIEGTTVLTSRWVPLPQRASKARFYLDRIDVSAPSSPVVLDPVNIPGSLLSFDSATGRLLTTDYELVNGAGDRCGGGAPGAGGSKQVMRHSFKLADVSGSSASLLATTPIDDGVEMLNSVLVGEDRVFAKLASIGSFAGRLMVVGGMKDGGLQVSFAEEDKVLSVSTPVAVQGKRLVTIGSSSSHPLNLGVLDATNLDSMTFEHKDELAPSSYTTIALSGDAALCSQGQYGMQVIELGK